MVELEEGPVLVGGQTQDIRFLDTLYQMAPGADGKLGWKLMDKKLATARCFHNAFLVDGCTEEGESDNLEQATETTEATSAEDNDDSAGTTPSLSN